MLRYTQQWAVNAAAGKAAAKMQVRRAFWQRRCDNFRRRDSLGKLMTLGGYGLASISTYVALCLVVRTFHQPTVDELFAPGADYTLENWADVEPTLRPGDILLMRGSGPMSWCITTLQFVLSFLNPAALRYSHVAVVVAPALIEYVDDKEGEAMGASVADISDGLSSPPYRVENLRDVFFPAEASRAAPSPGCLPMPSSSASAPSVREQLQLEERALHGRRVVRRGAIILEAMDNKDFDVRDVKGNITYDAVQIVEASRRLYSRTPSGEPAYHYFAVRRLQNYEHTPERQRRLARFCEESEGRGMDCSLLYPLAFLWPRLHTRAHPLRQLVTGEVSCSELVVELFQELGVVRRRWRWVPLAPGTTTPAPAVTWLTKSEGKVEHAENDEFAALAASSPPPPTAADVTGDRRGHSLHIYDFVYGRLDTRGQRPVFARERPLLPDADVVENGDIIAAADLHRRSTTARLRPVWEEVDRMTGLTDLYGRLLTGPAEEAARQKLKRRTAATYITDPDVPKLDLRAGDTAKGTDGRDYQLQWYYAHNSVATGPFHFTQGAGESVLDFAENVGLGPEVHMPIAPDDGMQRWHMDEGLVNTPGASVTVGNDL